jgi:CRP-like cAMP-binding protein
VNADPAALLALERLVGEGLTAEERELMLWGTRFRLLRRGEFLAHAGDVVGTQAIVLSGGLFELLENDDMDVVVDVIGPGRPAYLAALLGHQRHATSLRAVQTAQVAVIPPRLTDRLFGNAAAPALFDAVRAAVVRRQEIARCLSAGTLVQRLEIALGLLEREGVKATQSDLAAMISANRQRVNQALRSRRHADRSLDRSDVAF